MKVAVTVLLEFMVIVVGLVDPLKSPLQLENNHPESGVAVSVTTVPASYVPPGGFNVTVPLPTVLTVKVYCTPSWCAEVSKMTVL